MSPMPVTKIAEEADRRNLNEAIAVARRRPMKPEEVADSLMRQIRSKVWWIENFSAGSRRRPQHEIDAAQVALTALVHAYDTVRQMRGAGDAVPQ